MNGTKFYHYFTLYQISQELILSHHLSTFLLGKRAKCQGSLEERQKWVKIKQIKKQLSCRFESNDGQEKKFVIDVLYGCFGTVFWPFFSQQWNSAYAQLIQYISKMGACLIDNTSRGNQSSTLTSPTIYRAEIQAEPSAKPLITLSSKILRECSVEGASNIKYKTITRTDSRQQNSQKMIGSNQSLKLEGLDNGSRPSRQVAINKEKTPVSLAEIQDRQIIQQKDGQDQQDKESEEGEQEEGNPEVETPSNRLYDPQANMLNCGLTDSDNRMIALTIAAKEPLKINAIKLRNGSIYNGEWMQGKRHGRGTLTWQDGSRYEGQWRNDYSQGQGKLIYNENEYYQGTFVRNCRQGNGKYVNFNLVYEGEWRGDKRQGHGVESWGKGEHYEGQWLAGCKNGQGQLFFEDGSYYKGQFCGNQLHGRGIYCWMNSRTYEGEWQHNRISGLGFLTWNSGQRYQGQFKYDKMHGLGVLTHADRSISSGVFQNGRKQGTFTQTDPQGNNRQIQYHMGKKLRAEDGSRPFKSQNNSYTMSSATVTRSF